MQKTDSRKSKNNAAKNKSTRKTAFTSTLIATAVSMTFSACAPGFQSGQDPVAAKLDETLGCSNFEDALWSAFNKSVEDHGRPPYAAEIEASMKSKFKTATRLSKISESSKTQISSVAGKLAATIALRNDGEFKTANVTEPDAEMSRGLWLERIAQLEIGDRTTDEKSADVDAVQSMIAELKKVAETEGLVDTACAAPPELGKTPSPSPQFAATMFDTWKATQAPPVYGGMKTIATIYQSCESGIRGSLGSDVANVQGITVTGKHSSGTGNVRQITNLKSFLASHPYLGKTTYKRPLPTCQDVQATPSIYDYGGKPFTTTTNEKVLNLFKNGGTGSKDLGIDCSALVYTSYATVGLKFKKETSLKASLVNGVSSTMLTEPMKNGLTCLNHASFTPTSNIQPGDIIAIKGHVVMVADVGPDPLGIGAINAIGQCTKANMSANRFNFTIFQSAPVKGGIGVSRMRASYYLTAGTTMGNGMIDHAVNACKAKFQKVTIVTKSASASVVRHLGTAACADATPIALTKEECLSSCSARGLDSI